MTKILDNGNLLITADNEFRRYIREGYEECGYIGAECNVMDYLRSSAGGWIEMLKPEVLGALTSAPILTIDPAMNDDGDFVPFPTDAPVWWYPDYAVSDPWEELKNKGRVVFQVAT